MSEEKWADLEPDPAMVAALDAADSGGSRKDALVGTRAERNLWSNRFADACAAMVSAEI